MNATHRRYLGTLALAALAAMLLAAAVVVVADPYRLYALVQRPGLNADKPLPKRFRNEIKLAGAERSAATQFLVGNSRIEVGFDPDSPLLGGRAYNLGLAGTGASTAIGQLEYLRSLGVRPTRVIAGIDFHDALLLPGTRPAAGIAVPQPEPAWRWRFETLFSMAALKDAAGTFAMQGDREAETMTAGGLNPLNQYHKYAREDGYYKIFRQRAEENAAVLVRKAPGSLDREGVRTSLRALLQAALRGNEGAEVRLLVYAYHAQLLALYEASGLWPRFEEWKDILLEEAAAARVRYPQARIVLHDFSGFGEFNCEAIPGPGQPGHTRWYWEAGHQKAALGEEMIRRMLEAAPADGFGMPLTAETRERNRQRIAAERARCAAAQPELFAQARELVQGVQRKRGKDM